MSQWKKVFESNISLYARIIKKYLLDNGWTSISLDNYIKTMPAFQVKDAILSKEYKKEGKYPIVSQSKDLISGYFDDKLLLNQISKPIIIFGDHTQVVKYIDFDFILGADGTKILTVSEDYNPKFFYYLIKAIDLHSNKYARHYSKLRKENIPYCKETLLIQSNIVSFLDSLADNCISHKIFFDEKTEQEIITLQKKFYNISSIEIETEIQKTYVKQLRQNILQDAIEGKLTADWRKLHPVIKGNPAYDAEALFEKIQKGDVSPSLQPAKRSSATPSAGNTPATPPFEIPESWKWVKLGELCNFGNCQNIEPDFIKPNDWILDLEDIEKDTGRIISIRSFSKNNSQSTKHVFYKGFVLYSKLRPYLNKVVIAPKDGYCTSEILPLDFGSCNNAKFMQIALMSPYFVNYTTKLSYGMKMPRLGTNDGKKAWIPLPPLKEQEEIVTKVETLLAKVTELENQIQERKTFSEKLAFGIIKEKLKG
ncbi:MAG: restriction endonuclease subunit S [Treponema sp.]|nr:restriction endonuclease subunit S [Treponema sp.]